MLATRVTRIFDPKVVTFDTPPRRLSDTRIPSTRSKVIGLMLCWVCARDGNYMGYSRYFRTGSGPWQHTCNSDMRQCCRHGLMLSHVVVDHVRGDGTNVSLAGMPSTYDWFIKSVSTGEYWTFVKHMVRADNLCRITLKGKTC